MNKLITILTFMILVSCSQKDSGGDSSSPTNQQVPEVLVESKDIIVSDPETVVSEAILFKIESIIGQKVKKRFNIRNQSDATLSLVDLNTLGDDFVVTRNRCRSTLGRGRSCYFDIEITYSESLQEGSTQVLFLSDYQDELSNPRFDLVIEIDETYADAVEASEGAIKRSDAVINFGTLTAGKTKVKRFYFINSSETLALAAPSVGTLPTGVSVQDTNCGVNIERTESCYIDYQYTYQGEVGSVVTLNEVVAITSDKMVNEDKSIRFQASNVEAIDDSVQKLSLSGLDLPASNQAGVGYVKRIYISNAIDTPYVFGGDSILSGGNEIKNTCLNLTLKKDQYCYIDVSVSSEQNNGEISVGVSIPDANVEEVYTNGVTEPSTIVTKYDNSELYDLSDKVYGDYTSGDSAVDLLLAKDVENNETERQEVIDQALPVSSSNEVLHEVLNRKFRALKLKMDGIINNI